MPNTREKLIEILSQPIYPHELVDPLEALADYLLDNGVTIHPTCEHCQCSDTISCPAGRVWCSRMMRYMKLDGFCSEGKEKINEKDPDIIHESI